MEGENKSRLLYLIILIAVSVFAVGFVASMGYLNYHSTAMALEEQVLTRVEAETVSSVETAISFGKSFDNYYGMEEVFASFSDQMPGLHPFVINTDGGLLYETASEDGAFSHTDLVSLLSSHEFTRSLPDLVENGGGSVKAGNLHGVFSAIRQDEEIIGYFGCLYTNETFRPQFVGIRNSILIQSIIIALIVCLGLIIFIHLTGKAGWVAQHPWIHDQKVEKFLILLIMVSGILVLSLVSLLSYQGDYRKKVEDSIHISLQQLQTRITHVQEQGVDLQEVDGLKEYIEESVNTLEVLRAIRISERISEVVRISEASDLITFVFGDDTDSGKRLYLEAELSDSAIKREINSIFLTLLSTMIILVIFVFELNNLVDLFTIGLGHISGETGFSEKQVSLSLRFTGFLCSTAEYMCVPYAAMLIRESGESLFGLSVGMTAALPLTMESLMQMFGMLFLPRLVKKYNVKTVLLVSAVLMALTNVAAFTVGSALVIILCRTLAGIAYAGFKQVSNYLITRGYDTDAGRSANISQDNAGLLAGSTCGAGLGAILSANSGYTVTFLVSACIFIAYLAVTWFLLPWTALATRAAAAEEEKPIVAKNIFKMIFSPEMLMYIILIGIPLNIGVMLCVTLVPAICQTNGISSVMLSYCYIANGIAGIYIGPALVNWAKRRFGLELSITFAFALTAVSIFILRIPPVAVMIVVTSMILGFLDGFGTPMCTDRFMELKVVKEEVDESTALIFSVVLSYVLLTFAPMIAELLLLPGKGAFSPMMAGAAAYAVAAVLLAIVKGKNSVKKAARI